MSIGSGSKSFTATALGLLMEDFATGRNVTALPRGVPSFTWQTAIKDLLPGEWKLEDQWASDKANVHDILSHVSGLPR
jgi:CubicO group peptidase (beta-lactamase class C family)